MPPVLPLRTCASILAISTATWACVAIGSQGADLPAAVASQGAADSASDAATLSPAAVWAIDDVTRMAAAHSPAARLLETERMAVGCGLERDNADACAQVRLIQIVYRRLIDAQRTDDANDAARVYYQAVAAEQQKDLLAQSAPLLDALEALAATAERLNLPDGDRDLLADQRLEQEDLWYQADFGLQRLRNQLSQKTGQSVEIAQRANLVTPLLTQSEPSRSVDEWIELAMRNRQDLAALETLCRCLNSANLPAARQLLGWLSPGLGNSPPSTPGGGGLLALHLPKISIADLACRQSQCQQLIAERRAQIQGEVRDAAIQLEEAVTRSAVAQRRVQGGRAAVERARREIELEQAPPGSDTQAELESLRQQSTLVERQLAITEAIIRLREVTGSDIAEF